MKKTETIHLAGLSSYEEQIGLIMQHNPDYDLTMTQLEDAGKVGERIYESICEIGETTLSPADDEQGNILVLADGVPVGCIIRKSIPKVSEWMEKGSISSLELTLQGGDYKILLADGEGEIRTEQSKAGWYGLLNVTYEDGSDEVSGTFEDDASQAFISTSYATTVLEKDSGKRGNAAMAFVILTAGSYLVFSGLYWGLNRMGRTPLLPVLGGNVEDKLIYTHLGIAAGGLIAAIAGLLTKNWVWPLLSVILFALSCYFVPGYSMVMILPVLFAGIAALRRKSSKRIVTFLKVLVFLGGLGAIGYFLYPTAQNVLNYHTLVITPTNEAVDDSALPDASGDEDYEEYDEDYGGDYDDDFAGDFDDDFVGDGDLPDLY